MQTVWFIIVSLMVATYVVLDGFDFGAGILHLCLAKTDLERRSIIAAIGPLWDGNEVWLLAGGGALFFAFPRAYAAGFSGFYLPLTMVLWLLMLRGISIEFRSKEPSPLWRSFWDGTFFLSSALMAIVLGAALGNVIRGVPLNAEGYFSGPLFTNFALGPHPGVLDWYTVTIGVLALAMLAMHGALFLRIKLTGDLHTRATKVSTSLFGVVVVLIVVATVATIFVQPQLYPTIFSRPLGWICAVAVLGSLIAIPLTLKRSGDGAPFFGSCGLIASLLAATAVGVYPTVLPSTLSPENSLTISNASSGEFSLHVGLYWWLIAIPLAVFYFIYLFRTFGGKVNVELDYGH
jgi:cytochrome d ubiquinol oxidase subunit II